MWSRNLLYRFYVGLVFMCALGAIVYAPQGARGQTPRIPDGAIHIMIPQFVAEAVSFKANDETGYDWAGSDEVYAVFSDLIRTSPTSLPRNRMVSIQAKLGPSARMSAASRRGLNAITEFPTFCTSKSRFGRGISPSGPSKSFVMATLQAFTILSVTENVPVMI